MNETNRGHIYQFKKKTVYIQANNIETVSTEIPIAYVDTLSQ